MSAGMATLEQRLADLEQAGAATWDQPGLALVHRLLAAARQTEAELCMHLLERAALHLDRFAQAFEASRAQAHASLEDLGRRGVVEPARWQAKLDTGAFREVQRLARRHRYGLRRMDPAFAARRAELEARATARGITSPGTLEAPSAEVLAATLYRDALAGANASLVVARAVASVPEDAGRYNPVRVATRAIEALSEHPPYLQAQLARLEVVALLRALAGAGERRSQNAAARSPETRKRN